MNKPVFETMPKKIDARRNDQPVVWRAGEGQGKLWLALFFCTIRASMMQLFLVRTDLIWPLGSAIFMPNAIGWAGAVWAVVVVMVLWYLVCGWQDQDKQAGVLRLLNTTHE